MSDDEFVELSVVATGKYGSLQDVRALDARDYLNILEFERIINAIEHHEIESAKNGNSK